MFNDALFTKRPCLFHTYKTFLEKACYCYIIDIHMLLLCYSIDIRMLLLLYSYSHVNVILLLLICFISIWNPLELVKFLSKISKYEQFYHFKV